MSLRVLAIGWVLAEVPCVFAVGAEYLPVGVREEKFVATKYVGQQGMTRKKKEACSRKSPAPSMVMHRSRNAADRLPRGLFCCTLYSVLYVLHYPRFQVSRQRLSGSDGSDYVWGWFEVYLID